VPVHEGQDPRHRGLPGWRRGHERPAEPGRPAGAPPAAVGGPRCRREMGGGLPVPPRRGPRALGHDRDAGGDHAPLPGAVHAVLRDVADRRGDDGGVPGGDGGAVQPRDAPDQPPDRPLPRVRGTAEMVIDLWAQLGQRGVTGVCRWCRAGW
jgi:hypothetical protein